MASEVSGSGPVEMVNFSEQTEKVSYLWTSYSMGHTADKIASFVKSHNKGPLTDVERSECRKLIGLLDFYHRSVDATRSLSSAQVQEAEATLRVGYQLFKKKFGADIMIKNFVNTN